MLRGLKRPALKLLFGEVPVVSVVLADEEPIESAVTAIVQALGLAPQDATPRPDPLPAPPLAELVIELDEPHFAEESGIQHAAAKARVRYETADGGPGIKSKLVTFAAPLGPREAAELRWYLEAYGLWPFGVFKDRARALEESLPVWGRKLFDAILGHTEGRGAFNAWRDAGKVDRRITVLVDERDGNSEAAAMLLALPWELLADEQGYLFEGNLKARVRRMLPSERALSAVEPHSPLRVLLVLARPEDESASFLDPRASAIPLAEALDPLSEDVFFTVLADGSFKALREELDAGERAGQPYQVVHFDGHGVYDAQRGLGQLCFENADDAEQGKLERRTERVDAAELGALLRERRVALFVLEACQTAMTAENPTASVAAALLASGVASVVAMSHAVYVETGRRFVAAFYEALAAGDRIGAAMVRAQHALKDDRARGEVGPGELVLSDWMVPVLFQEHADARLFPRGVDARSASIEDRKLRAKVRHGELPEPPAHGFVGRARSLLVIDRRLRDERWLALIGGGGQGKTALAVEAARWLLAMRRVDRLVFVSVEEIGEARVVLDMLGRQIKPGYLVAVEEGIGSEIEKRQRAMLSVKRELQQRRVLLVVDNLESVLPTLGEAIETGAADLLGMLRELCEVGGTRLILTSRVAPPTPLEGNGLVLPALGRGEGMTLLAGVLRVQGLEPLKAEEDKEAVERLVEALGGHARALVLLGGLVAEKRMQAVADDVRGMMIELEERYPDQRERSLIASARLSLQRLPEAIRRSMAGLAVFQRTAHVTAIATVLQITTEDAYKMARALINIGLATTEDGRHLILDPALGAVISADLTAKDFETAKQRWLTTTVDMLSFLYHQQVQDSKISNHGVRMVLAELFAALTMLAHDTEASSNKLSDTLRHVVSFETLVSNIGMPTVLARVIAMRRILANWLPDGNDAKLASTLQDAVRLSEAGDLLGSITLAQATCSKLRIACDHDHELGYDLAVGLIQLGQSLRAAGRSEEALHALKEAQNHLLDINNPNDKAPNKVMSAMLAAAISEEGNALITLGRFNKAAIAYNDSIQRNKDLGNKRGTAIGYSHLGLTWYSQGIFNLALNAYKDALAAFTELEEPGAIAQCWHQIGLVYAAMKNFEAAEAAYKSALELDTRLGNHTGAASAHHQLASLYTDQGYLDDAAALYQQAIEIKKTIGNALSEATSTANLGSVLHKLHRLDDARAALKTALDIMQVNGYELEQWRAWLTLEDVEREAGQVNAAGAARREALRTYRAYRTGGGEPPETATRFILVFGQTLRETGPDAARALLDQLTDISDRVSPTTRTLYEIAAGNRDVTLADDSAHHPMNAVELSLLLESLPPAAPASPPPSR